MSLPIRGFDRLQPQWSKSAVAAAARAAAEAAAEDSDGSQNSENFLISHMHKWSRDSGSQASFPPPPEEESRRNSRGGTSDVGRRSRTGFSDPGRHSRGGSDAGNARIGGVPEEVPIMPPIEREARRANPAGFWQEQHEEGPRDMSVMFPASQRALEYSQLSPWLQRAHLPPPPDAVFTHDDGEHQDGEYEQDHFAITITPPPVTGHATPGEASPQISRADSPRRLPLPPVPPPTLPAVPSAADQLQPEDEFSRRWPTLDFNPVPLRSPDQGHAEAHSFHNPLAPWRHMQHQYYPEDVAPIWQENPRGISPIREEQSMSPLSQASLAHGKLSQTVPDMRAEVRQEFQDEPCPMPSPSAGHKVDRILIPPQSTAAPKVCFLDEVSIEQVPVGTEDELAGLEHSEKVASHWSISAMLSPKRKEMLRCNTKFQANALPVSYKGKLYSQSILSLGEVTNGRCTRCYRYCCRSDTLLIPCCTLFLSLLFACGFAMFLWMAETPDVTEGAFGLICQAERGAPINYSYFEKAREHAIASLSVLQRGDSEDATTDQTTITIDNATRIWRHVEVIFAKTGGGLLTSQNVDAIRLMERKMLQLPGWRKLCNEKVPSEVQHFCNVGDSFPAVVFGTSRPADQVDAEMGALSKIVYNGESAGVIMPLEQFVNLLKDFQAAALKRWFAMIGPHITDSPMRTTYAFSLSEDNLKQWDDFVQNELEPLLHDEAIRGDGQNSDGSGYLENEAGIRLFYRADGLSSKEFVRAVAEDAPLRWIACLAAFFGVLLTSRRVLLAIASAVLSLTAPLAASTLAAGRGPNGNLEYPATTVAAWFVVAIGCGELALATANAWEVKETAPTLPRFLSSLPGWNFFGYRLLRFLLEVPAPTLCPAISLCSCGFIVDLPLVTEFTTHVSLGLASACIYGVLLFPPACEVGDRLRDYALNSQIMKEMQETTHGWMPYECGGQPEFVSKMEILTTHLIEAISSKTVRAFAFVVFLAIVVVGSLEETSPMFVSEAPELFHEGHRLRVAPKVRELFGSGEVLGNTGAPVDTLRFARTCTPDAHDKLECSWYKCEVDGQKEIVDGKCSCFKQTSGDASEIRKCGAAVRFASLPPGSDAFAKVSFWRWAEEQMGVIVVNNSLSAWQMGVLEMESWATGQVTTETQTVVKTHGADGRAPAWEDACMRVLCYCGQTQCKLDSAWQSFGEPTITAPDRRLQLWGPTQLQKSARPAREDAIEVNVVWGLTPTTRIPRKVIKTRYSFGTFRIENPWVQRNVHGFCHGLYPRLHVYERRCWALDFKRWLNSRGDRFPVPAADFYDRFHRFAAHYAHLQSQQPGRDTYNYFWLNNTGNIQGCYATFKGFDSDRLGLTAYRKLWMLYGFRRNVRNDKDTGDAWQASPQFAAHEAAVAVKDSAMSTMLLLLVSLAVMTFFLTCSPGLALAIVLIEVVALFILVVIGVGLGKRDFGAMEVSGLATFMSLLATPLIRVAHQYALARDGPGDPPSGSLEEARLNDDPLQFRPRSASISGQTDASVYASSPIKVRDRRAEGEDEEYLVDNSILKAKTCGLGYRLSPDLKDLDKKSRSYQGLAPWGSTIVGKRYMQEWIKVGPRFLPVELNGCPVLVLQERGPSFYERVFAPETSEEPMGCIEDLKLFFLGPYEDLQIWRGAFAQERKRRSLSAVRRMSHTVIGASIAGIIAGCGLVPMRMEALGRIGLAVLCAAVTAPTAALGILPMLAMVPFLGPSRVRRSAFAQFVEWVLQGKPRGSQEPPDPNAEVTVTSYSSPADSRSTGEAAAEVLGLPFSLTVKSFSDHIPDWLSWIVGGNGRRYHHTADARAVRNINRLRSESYDD